MWFFLYQKSFPLIKCSPNHFNFVVNFNIFQNKRFMCSKHSKNKNTYTFLDFNIRMSFYIIIKFVIMFQSKVIDLSIMWSLMQKKLSFHHVICHKWPQIWYSIKKTMSKMQSEPIKLPCGKCSPCERFKPWCNWLLFSCFHSCDFSNIKNVVLGSVH
jgi:hypothetical protein